MDSSPAVGADLALKLDRDAGDRAIQGAVGAKLADIRQRIYIAYSGGVDSHVLLHCCASMAQFKDKLTAVYVDHGLQAASQSWAGHCEKTAEDLGVNFLTLQVNAKAAQGEVRKKPPEMPGMPL